MASTFDLYFISLFSEQVFMPVFNVMERGISLLLAGVASIQTLGSKSSSGSQYRNIPHEF